MRYLKIFQRVIFPVIIFLFSMVLQSQTVVLNEDFEGGTYVVTPGGTPTWSINSTLQVSGVNSFHNVVALNDSSWVTTNVMDFTGQSFVLLEFQHICKIEFFDAAEILISVDNGTTWTKLTSTEYINLNNSQFSSSGDKFTATAYPTAWEASVPGAVPTNSWWRKEQFNLSSIAANQSQVRIKFRLRDMNGNGANLNAGWYLDDIKVVSSPFELIPPSITLNAPIPQDTLLGTGPFPVSAEITDASGISVAYLIYTVNSNTDTITMVNTSGNTYQGTIPSMPLNSHVDWYVSAFDSPPALNNASTTVRWFYNKKQPAEVIVGSESLVPGNTLYHPIYRFSNSSTTSRSLSVVVYTQSELAAAGIYPGQTITKLAWDKAGTGGTNSALDYKMWMRNSTTTPPLATTTTWQYVLTNFTQVYSNTNYQVPAVAGWHEVVLTTPFVYTGGSIEVASETFFSGTQPWTTDKFDWKYSAGTETSIIAWTGTTAPTGATVLNATVAGYKHRPNTKFYVDATVYPLDAGVIAITAPTGTQITGTPTPVLVTLKNFGSDILNSVDIQYSVNGVLQGTYNWSGSLSEDMVATNLNIGNATFVDGNNQLKVWTTAPNLGVDQSNVNDTSVVNLWSCQSLLSGNYTINSALATGGTNFQTFADAFAALNNCGVNGPVVFELHDALYDLAVNVNEIPGSSAINTVTFKPATGMNVVITSASTTSTIRLNATKNIIFDGSNDGSGGRNLTIRNTSTAANTAAIWLSSLGVNPVQGCQNVTIKNCIVEAGSNVTTSTFGVYVGGTTITTSGNGNNNNNIRIENNHIRLAYIGIYARSASPNFNTGLIIEDNQIGSTNPVQYVTFRGIDLQGATNPIISSNFIHNLRIATAVNNAGIEIGQNVSGAQIMKNNIQSIYSTSSSGYGAYGINIATATGVSNILIANNFISDLITSKYSTTSTTWNPFGIRITGGTNINVYNNSINLFGEPTTGTSASMSACLVVTAAVTNLDVRNNIFANSMTGNAGSKSYTVYKVTAATFANSNHNNYYPSGTFGIFGYSGTADVTTLAGWQTVTTFDANSVNINPIFVSPTDLHTFNPSMNNLGTPLAEVIDDIDGDPRDPSTPDIGADEYTPLAEDLAITAIIYPTTVPCNLTNNEFISFRVKNMGGTTVTAFDAAFRINGGTEVVESFVTNILPDSLQTFVFTTPADFSAIGTFSLAVRVSFTGDLNPLNDSINGYQIRHGHDFYSSAYIQGFEPVHFPQDWTVFNFDGSAFKWDVPFSGIPNTGSNSARFNNGAANSGEDWMFSRCFTMQAGEAYDLSFFFRGSSTITPASFQVFAGNTNTPAGMTIPVVNHASVLNTTYQKSLTRFTVPVSGTYYFGWKNNTAPSTILTYIDDINIKLIPAQEAAILSSTQPEDGCDLGLEPVTVKIKNLGADTIHSIQVFYQITGQPTIVSETVNSSFGPNDTLTYTFTALADLTTTVDETFEFNAWIALAGDPMQNNDTIVFNVESLVTPPNPVTEDAIVNYGSQATLVATSTATVYWYNSILSTVPFHYGDTLHTSPLFNTTTYYVEASSGSTQNIGMPAALPTATSGAGTTNFGLVFDVFIPTLIKSVTVYPVSASGASGTVTIDVIDGTGTVLHTTTANVTGSPVGTFSPHVINLDFNVMPGTNLKMRPAFTGITGLLFEPAASAPAGNYGFPYSIPGVITINTSTLTAHPTNTPRNDLYYYFYNWEVGALGCSSGRVPITATVIMPQFEPEIISIVQPLAEECSDNANIVSIEITNNGSDTITSGLTASYQIQGGTPVTENVITPVAPGDTILFAFATPFALNLTQGDSTILIAAWVNHPSDPYNLNDTTSRNATLVFTAPMPLADNDTIPYGTQATLVAQSAYNLQWYATPSSSTVLDTGHVFVTPVLYANTPYYVSAMELANAKESMGMVNAVSTSSFITATVGWGLFFSNTEPIFIDSVYVYPSGSGTITIQILDSLTNAVLYTGPVNNIFGDGTNSPSNKKPVFVGLTIPTGSYKMGMTYTGITNLIREISGATHPYISPSGTARITAGANGGASPSTGTYYWFYDWKIKTASEGCESPRAEVWAIIDTLTVPNVDAGVVSIDEPASPANLQPNDVKVTIRNYGSDPLTTVDIAWTINGVSQTTYTWNGLLNQGDTQSDILIGNNTFQLGINNIVAWTENPNGVADVINSNDTATYTLYAFEALCGTYQIGGSNPDFATINDAIYGLNNWGVSCPVIFELHNANFNEIVVLDTIPGSSAINTVTFKPGPGMNVEITSTSANATWRMNATKNVIIDGSNDGSNSRNLTISNTATTANTTAIWIASTGTSLIQGCSNITVKNTIIEGGSNTVTSAFGLYIGGNTITTSANGNHNNNISVVNNHFRKAHIALYVRSASPNFNTGLLISENEIGSIDPTQYVTYRGIDIQGAVNPVISSNHIHNLRVSTAINNAGIEIGQNVSGAQIVKNNIHTIYSTSASGYGAYGINIATSTGVSNILIANNFISDLMTVKYSATSTTWNPFGIRITGGSNIRIYNNSINLFGEPTIGINASMSACLLVTTAVTGLDVRNNIFANSMTGNAGSKSYSVFKVTSVVFAQSNHNNYFPSGPFGFVGYSGSADIPTLTGWRTVTTQDVNSISEDPYFFTNTDLHTFSGSVNALATPLAEVIDDIDGDLRNPLTPDIGADEFDPAALDAAMVAVLTPASGCLLTSAEIITVRIKNAGMDTLTTFNVSYSINGGTPVVETWNGSLPSGNSADYVFTQTANMSALGVYTIIAEVDLAGDALAVNNTKTRIIKTAHDFYGSNYFMGFESGEDYSRWTVVDVNSDNRTWEPGYNSTTFARTGARSARFFNGSTNPGNDYLFTECFYLEAGTSYKVEFWYRVESASYAQNTNLVVATDVLPSAVIDTLTQLQLYTNTVYQMASGIYTPATDGIYYFGWHAISPASIYYSFIDDINIRILAPQDAGAISVDNVDDMEDGGSTINLEITIKNFGSQTLTSVPVSYSLNGGAWVTETWTGSMIADATSTYTFATPFTVPDGNYTLCVRTELSGDGNPGNDQTCVNKYGLPVLSLPHFDDLEGTQFWYVEGTGNQWQFGTPSASIINSAYSPTKAWATVLAGNYANNSSYYLYTPKFNFSNVNNMVLGFWHWMETENGVDGGKIQYSSNGGATWLTLGILNDPNGTNWYNTANINNAPGFSGSTGGWVYSEISLAAFNFFPLPVQFRFHFYSNATITNNGWAIDNFEIYQPQIPFDAGVIAIEAPVGQSVTGGSNQVTVRLKNFGTQTLTSIPVTYRVLTGAPPVNGTWTGSLAPDAETSFTFPTPFTGPFQSSYGLCAWTSLAGDSYTFNDTTCVTLNAGAANIDGAVVAILNPTGTTVAGTNVSVTVRVKNLGLQPLTNIPVQYSLNGTPQTTESVIGTLAPGDSTQYTFITTFVSPATNYQLCAKTSIAGDAIISNDQICYDMTTGIGELEIDGIVLLQNIPNPATDETVVGFSLPSGGQLLFSVTNVLGEVIYSETSDYAPGKHTIMVNTKNMAAGVYYYSITFNQTKLTRKMIVQ